MALIPARGGSKGVPGKNIKSLHGSPLIFYSIDACKKSSLIDRVIVSTDDQKIADISQRSGAEVPFLRPAELAQDNTTDYEVLKHFLSVYDCESVVYIRPTTPIRDFKVIDEAINIYKNKKNTITSLRSMHRFSESPYKMFKINKSGFCEGFFEDFNGIKNHTNLPRQSFPAAYQPNGYIDIVKRETIENGTTYGAKIFPYVTETVIEVDTQFEFDLLELQIKKYDKN